MRRTFLLLLSFTILHQTFALGEKIFPNLVRKDEKGILSLNYIELIPLLINAMQEQNSRIKQLEDAIKVLKQ